MKICTKCKEEKALDSFGKKGKGLNSQCKSCVSEWHSNYWKQDSSRRQRVWDKFYERRDIVQTNVANFLKQNPCKECGESNILKLDFDHIDPSEKVYNISEAIQLGRPWSKIENEIKKCQVLCASCHRVRSAYQSNNWKLKFI